jgi:RNA polymerase sigma-70 factor, ECF subfamily
LTASFGKIETLSFCLLNLFSVLRYIHTGTSKGRKMLTDTTLKKGTWSTAMDEPQEDIKLARRIAAGDDSALQELNAMYGKRLFAYALRLTGDQSKAEDVIQDVLVVVWRTASRYRGEGRFIAWLLGIVHHTAMNSIRHSSIPISEEMEESLPSSTSSPESQTQLNQQSEWVRKGLADLSIEHRAVLELVFYQGLSLEEIAQVSSCPLGTVKSRLAYARQHLKGILSRQGLEEWQ